MSSSRAKSISYSSLNHRSRKILDTEMLAVLMPLRQSNNKQMQCWKCHFHKKSISQETTWIGMALFTKTPWLQGNKQCILKHISRHNSGIIKEVYKPMESTWSWFLMADFHEIESENNSYEGLSLWRQRQMKFSDVATHWSKAKSKPVRPCIHSKNICWVYIICKTLFWIQTVPCQ